ncbi:metal dependent phosphohydrolase with GAF sensor [Candidatus Magnetomorum sp. HK-1]|nr:metal dependent phosphohydrolase with GAF sensor [Candidatus Magnetomorum sp. HK-1]
MNEKEKLDRLIELGIELNKVQDLDILLERVLFEARNFTNADAGSIYIREQDQLHFTYTQNDTLQKQLPEGEKLIYSTFRIPIDSTSLAGYVAVTGQVLNLPDAYITHPQAPYKFSRQFDQTTGYKSKSVCTIPLNTSRGDILGILQLINAHTPEGILTPFSSDDESLMLHFASIASVALERAQMNRGTFLRMLRMSDLRDPRETGAHVNRVGAYAVELYERWAIKHHVNLKEMERNRDIMRIASMMHDVGKVGISDLILKKPGRYNENEFDIMKQHTILGARLFLDVQSEYDEASFQVTLNHHERWDGKGYPGYIDVATGDPIPQFTLPDGSPRGKKEEEIPLFARIVFVVDVFDALATVRCYKKAWEESRVLDAIKEGAGTQFDPELVDIFLSGFHAFKAIQNRYQEE